MTQYYVCLDTNQKLSARKFKIGCQLETNKRNWTLHSHMGYEIYFFHEGRANYFIGNKVYQILPGDMLMLKGEILHGVNPGEGVYKRSFLNFLPELMEGAVGESFYERVNELFEKEEGTLIRWGLEDRHSIGQLISNISEEKRKENIGYQSMIISYLSQLLVRIYRKSKEVEERLDYSTWRQKDSHVERTLTYINENYMNEVMLDQIANELHINKYYMCHCFKEVTGISVNKYLSKRRIEEAKKLLLSMELSVQAISLKVGLNGTGQLSRLFKQYVGVSPLAFRKQHLTAKQNVE
ncbi:AraC family transcriptional regulator [Alkalihalobacillus macyae]|uniref:AraC family transcriptional regulator n=1 Tax=Guptibacillus hwajinpoensis TaxID=208199 RepID=UPI00273B137A|nr:AraC family transcriptional regulator [Alkalihalobacillus macyae]MDP4551119.1 AraC family transcriptional regulator [Alkalihalobacillus macyae]